MILGRIKVKCKTMSSNESEARAFSKVRAFRYKLFKLGRTSAMRKSCCRRRK